MPIRVHVRDGDDTWRVDIAGRTVTVNESPAQFEFGDEGDGRWRVARQQETLEACAVGTGDAVWVALGGELFELRIDPTGSPAGAPVRGREGLAAPMPATVLRIVAGPGTRVSRGDALIVLEAMKMELSIRAPRDGLVEAVNCKEGDLVQPGAPLVDLT